jgi:hypothetical protein
MVSASVIVAVPVNVCAHAEPQHAMAIAIMPARTIVRTCLPRELALPKAVETGSAEPITGLAVG